MIAAGRTARSAVGLAGGAGLADLLGGLGYRVIDPSSTEERVASLVEMDASGGDAPARALAACRELSSRAPAIIVAPETGFGFRLQAARAGAVAVIDAPADPIELSGWLSQFDGSHAPTTRVLIVDDDPFLSDAYRTILEAAGVEAHVETDPARTLEAIAAVRPDLLLLDMNMPGANGIEVARIIRQDRDNLSLPVVFLSAERDADRRLAARRIGGDDFILKPVRPEELVEIVAMRAARARSLREASSLDGLTGLLNRAAFEDRLAETLARGVPFSLALVDVDRFKRVNDEHGHGAGDDVLRALARCLRAGLRSTDTVARYGGEEFALLLAGADGATAARVVDRLRARFGALRLHAKGADAPLRCTFSAGLVGREGRARPAPDAPPRDGPALVAAADEALYRAKRTGRDRLVRAC